MAYQIQTSLFTSEQEVSTCESDVTYISDFVENHQHWFEHLIKLLQHQGVTHICGIPGGANLPMYDALAESDIKHILARHEQGAGFVAQGMARANGQAQVCFASSGPCYMPNDGIQPLNHSFYPR